MDAKKELKAELNRRKRRIQYRLRQPGGAKKQALHDMRLKARAEGKKYCASCEEIKPLDSFPPHRGRPDGRQAYCQTCHRAKQRQYKRDRGW